MPRWIVTVRQCVPDDELTKPDDRLDNPAGSYEIAGETEDQVLDAFHNTVAIGCLDDFDITAEVELATDATTAVVAARVR